MGTFNYAGPSQQIAHLNLDVKTYEKFGNVPSQKGTKLSLVSMNAKNTPKFLANKEAVDRYNIYAEKFKVKKANSIIDRI